LTVARYALDTNVYIDALRSPGDTRALRRFLGAAAPSTVLSAVVMMELRAGARTREQSGALEDGLFRAYARRGLVLVPTAGAFQDAGRVLARLAQTAPASRSLAHDALLAASCREAGVTLITRDADFARIARLLPRFRFVAPWP
jgi:predicted nucleic acid-binding protein